METMDPSPEGWLDDAERRGAYAARMLQYHVAGLLVATRELEHLSTEELARCVGETPAFVAAVERGEVSDLTLATIAKLWAALGLQAYLCVEPLETAWQVEAP